MQQRRLYHDDSRGVGECLNETDELGNGITVNARYYLQIFNRTTQPSLQRYIQLKQSNVPQYFFSFNYTINSSLITDKKPMNLDQAITLGAGPLPSAGKIELFPVTKNQIFVRIDNIGDNFDIAGLTNVTIADL